MDELMIPEPAESRAGASTALALASVPLALAALSRTANAQATPPAGVKAALDFALALEIFENELYKAVLGTSSSAAQNAAFATVRASVVANAGAHATLQQIQKHEAAHVATLLTTGATNGLNLTADNFDFTGARGAGNGPFAKAMTNLAFLLEMAQGVEDTGVRAYKGQLATLMASPEILEYALRIHSVEARHASRIRRLRRLVAGAGAVVRLSGTIRGGDAAAAGATDTGDATDIQTAVVLAFTRIYGAGVNSVNAPSEANVTQAGVNVSTLSAANVGLEAAQEAFDEPLEKSDVIAIVQPFFIPALSS